jgi:uncharacterized integral membrane protein (TIGR00698 family)
MSQTVSESSITSKATPFLQEDWVVVVVGAAIILIIISGVVVNAPSYAWSAGHDLVANVFGSGNLLKIAWQFVFIFFFAIVSAILSGKLLKQTLVVFPTVFIVSTVALVLAGNSRVNDLNLEAVIFSLILGLSIGNIFRLPEWFTRSLSTELYVKIGLIILGTSIIFGDILKAGSLGLVQALVVVLSVWYFAFWLCKKLKIDDELSMMISSAVSICGVSAAIATAGAIKGDPKKLSLVISLVLITAIPMMIVMPYIAKAFNFPEEVTGAWLGGTIDTTGAVVASGTLVGETALKISTIVKFSQNVLLGVAAFVISVYWTYNAAAEKKEVVSLRVIWERFPKFVLGFIAASLLFSFVVPAEVASGIKGSLKAIQTLWFVLAFTSIGLETRFADIFNSTGKRPIIGFLGAQMFNIIVTLIIAFLLFG